MKCKNSVLSYYLFDREKEIDPYWKNQLSSLRMKVCDSEINEVKMIDDICEDAFFLNQCTSSGI